MNIRYPTTNAFFDHFININSDSRNLFSILYLPLAEQDTFYFKMSNPLNATSSQIDNTAC